MDQEYISKVSSVDLGGNKRNVQKEEMDYKVFQFYVYDGVVDDMTMMFSTQNMDTIGKVRVKDYDLFSQYTLNDIIKLLNNNGHKYHMIDALAYHEFICLPTLDTLSDISFDFNWIEG